MMEYFFLEDSHWVDGYYETHSFRVNDDCLREVIWDNDSREKIHEEEMKTISFMLNGESYSSRVKDVLCEEKSIGE